MEYNQPYFYYYPVHMNGTTYYSPVEASDDPSQPKEEISEESTDMNNSYMANGYEGQEYYPYSYNYYAPYGYPQAIQQEGVSTELAPYSAPKDYKETAESVQQFVNEEDLFNDHNFEQGRIAPSRPLPIKKPEVITHENGIFGSYCLEDVKSIAKLVLIDQPDSVVSYDCFNYETIKEITRDKKVIYSMATPADHLTMYYTNSIALRTMQKDGKITYSLHYDERHNDLLQQRGEVVKDSENWNKFGRRFVRNMVFFNPYFNNGAGTIRLMNAFFDYARTNLSSDGIVIIMWNPERRDDLAKVKIAQIASKHSFRIIAKLSGDEFAQKTGFTHLKNSSSLKKAIDDSLKHKEENKKHSVVVVTKATDTIILFKKRVSSSMISSENKVATAMTNQLSSIDTYVE